MAIGTSLAVEFQDQLERRAIEFANALPSGIKPENFMRAAKTAIALNPKLLEADRRSLINELMRCAQDGLIPDAREAVLVIYKTKDGPKVRYQQMVAGTRKLVQQSGEIGRFEQAVVYSNDVFSYQLGDQAQIVHRPAWDTPDRGHPIAVYSIAQFKDGSFSREIMSVDEVEKVRAKSRAKDDGPWVEWWDEMARKTCAKRHAKVLPMSSDAKQALANDDDESDFRPLTQWPQQSRPHLADRLDNGPTPQPEDQSGRHPWTPPPDDSGSITTGPPGAEHSEAETVDEVRVNQEDFAIGRNDAEHGRTACLNSDIRNDPQRHADWQRGFDSYKPKRKR